MINVSVYDHIRQMGRIGVEKFESEKLGTYFQLYFRDGVDESSIYLNPARLREVHETIGAALAAHEPQAEPPLLKPITATVTLPNVPEFKEAK